MEFSKPELEYFELLPLLLVLGGACVGVLIEAFLARGARRIPQITLALSVLVAALVSTIVVGADLQEHTGAAGSEGRGLVGAEGSVIVDGPTVYLWGLVLIFAIGGVALFAERRLEGGVSAFTGQAAALPGTDTEREASTRGLEHTEVYPLMLFAVGGMLLFPASGDLLTMFVALEVLSLPLYLLCGLARRRRLLSQEAAMKYFLLGAFASGFFLYGAQILLVGTAAQDFARRGTTAAAAGFVDFMGYLGAFGGDVVTGWLLKHHDFHAAIMFWSSAAIVAALLSALLWRARPVSAT